MVKQIAMLCNRAIKEHVDRGKISKNAMCNPQKSTGQQSGVERSYILSEELAKGCDGLVSSSDVLLPANFTDFLFPPDN